jgi:hypothetical protein
MATRPKRPRDPSQLARLIVDISTGQIEDSLPRVKNLLLSKRRQTAKKSARGKQKNN